jgi:integrase
VGIYRDAAGRQCILEPIEAKTKSQAKSRLAEFLIPVNAERAGSRADTTLAGYTEKVYIPFGRRKWKGSTAITTIQRLRQHLVNDKLGEVPVAKLDRETMQAFLDQFKNRSTSLVNHLRFDLQAVLRLAVADGLTTRNQAEALYTPRTCLLPRKPVMTPEQVTRAFAVLDLRERAFVRLAIYAGMRPGEIIALKWSDIDERSAVIDNRIYKGQSDETKNRKARRASLSSSVMRDLESWRQFAPASELVFASDSLVTPVKYENLWQRSIKPKFEKIGLAWADFRCMRRTNATLMKLAGADVKVAADQRGHNVSVSINEYTQSTAEQTLDAVNRLETLIQ